MLDKQSDFIAPFPDHLTCLLLREALTDSSAFGFECNYFDIYVLLCEKKLKLFFPASWGKID